MLRLDIFRDIDRKHKRYVCDFCGYACRWCVDTMICRCVSMCWQLGSS